MSNPHTPTRRLEFLRILAGMFLVLFPVRLALVLMIAPETPFYDEWDSIIDHMARPMLAGDFSPHYLLEPHNEHPMLWTKVLGYLLLRVGDVQFDNVPVCEVSQFIYAVVASALIAIGAINLPRGRWWFVASAGIAAALPYAWENIGMGWGNSYYFLIAFAAWTIILASVMRSSVGSLIMLGVVAVASGLSMGSGPFAAIVAMFALAMRVRAGTLSFRDAARASVVLLLALAALAVLHTHAAPMAVSWGLPQSAELAVLVALLLPMWILILRVLRRQGGNADIAFACVALWGLMQIVAILLARPAFRLWYPISRYVDVLALTAFANIACLARLALAAPAQRTWILLSRITTIATIVATLAVSPFAWHWMNVRADNQREQTDRLVRYVRGGDTLAIEDADDDVLPYLERGRLRQLLDAADVRLILGDKVGTRPAPSAFVGNVREFNAALVRNAIWLLPLSLGFGLLTLVSARRSAPTPA